MGIPAQTINTNQLKKYNGEDEDRMHIAYKGIVSDVTDCPKWRHGNPEGLHFPGQNLSSDLDNGAPHAGGVFNHPCAKVVGKLDPFEDK